MSSKAATLALALVLCTAAYAAPGHRHANVGAARARHAALARYHGNVVGKVRLENEDGKWQYSVNVRSGRTMREVMVDAHTGRIASVEVTSAKEERAEARQEKREAKSNHPRPKKRAAN